MINNNDTGVTAPPTEPPGTDESKVKRLRPYFQSRVENAVHAIAFQHKVALQTVVMLHSDKYFFIAYA